MPTKSPEQRILESYTLISSGKLATIEDKQLVEICSLLVEKKASFSHRLLSNPNGGELALKVIDRLLSIETEDVNNELNVSNALISLLSVALGSNPSVALYLLEKASFQGEHPQGLLLCNYSSPIALKIIANIIKRAESADHDVGALLIKTTEQGKDNVLQLALRANNQPAVSLILSKLGNNTNTAMMHRNAEGFTAVHLALVFCHNMIMPLLKAWTKNPHQTPTTYTPLLVMSESLSVKQALSLGIETTSQDRIANRNLPINALITLVTSRFPAIV